MTPALGQAYLVPQPLDMVQLVVRYVSDDSGHGAYSVFKALTGKCLHNPLTSNIGKDLWVVRAVYGSYASLLAKAPRGLLHLKPSKWTVQVAPLPERPVNVRVPGPIFELYPLRDETDGQVSALRIAPWGPQKVLIGKHRKCHLNLEMESVSNIHAELCLMLPLGGSPLDQARLVISDMSKNGTWVNERRLLKSRFEELKDGHVLRVADVARFVAWHDCHATDAELHDFALTQFFPNPDSGVNDFLKCQAVFAGYHTRTSARMI